MAVDLISSIVDRANVSKQLQDTTTELQANYKALVDNIQAAALLNSVLGKSQGQKDFVRAQEQINQALLKNQALQEKIAQQAAIAEQKRLQEIAKTAQAEERLEAQRADRARKESARAAKEAADTAKNTSEYQKLVRAYNAATAAAREAGVVHGVQSEQFAAEAANVQRLRAQLDSIDQPLGNFQRNVGNYANSIGSLFTKVYGYIRTAANIIPGLGISGIFLAAFEGLKFLYDKIKGVGDQLDGISEKFKQAREAANENAAQEITKLDSLYDAATNLNIPFAERIRAVKELQKEYPAYFGNLTQEEILVGKAKSAYDALSDSIINQAVVKASQERISEALKPLIDTIAEQKRLQAELDKNNASAQAKNPNRTISFGSVDGNGKPIPGFRQPVSTGARPVVFDQSFIDDQTTAAKKAGTSGLQDVNTYKKRIIDAVKDARDSVQAILQDFGINSLLDPNAKEKKGAKPKNTALDVLNEQLEQAKNIRDRILQDENSSYDDRLKALYTYEHDTENLILAAESRKIITRLDAGNRAAEIENDSDKKRIELAKAAQKELQDLAKDQLEFQKEYNKQIQTVAEDLNTKATTKLLDEAQDSANEQLSILADQYKRGEITTQQYNDRKAEIERQANLNSQALTIAGLEQLIEIRKMFGLNETEDERKLADLKRKLSKDTTAAQLADLDKLNSEKKKGRDAEKAAAKALGDELLTLGKTLVDGQFTNQLNAVQAQKDALDDQTQSQIDAINREVGSNADKADKIAIINAKSAAQQKQLDQQARKIKHDQAVADKAFAVATIIENTAIGVSKALAEYIFPYSAIVAGLVGALGAAQIATVLSTPVPAYAEGVDNHPGGYARIGEAGQELVIEPGKNPWLTKGDTIMPLARGTQVISNRELIAATMSLGSVRDRESIPWGDLIKATKESRANVNVKPRVSGWLAEQRKAEKFNNYRNNHFN